MTLATSFVKARLALRTLQRAPEPVRRKWQRGISAIVFVIVITGWVFSLSASLGRPRVAPATTPKESGLFETLGKGFGVLESTISEEWTKLRDASGTMWNGLGAQLVNPSTFTFVREEIPFVPSPYEPIAPQTLPIR